MVRLNTDDREKRGTFGNTRRGDRSPNCGCQELKKSGDFYTQNNYFSEALYVPLSDGMTGADGFLRYGMQPPLAQ